MVAFSQLWTFSESFQNGANIDAFLETEDHATDVFAVISDFFQQQVEPYFQVISKLLKLDFQKDQIVIVVDTCFSLNVNPAINDLSFAEFFTLRGQLISQPATRIKLQLATLEGYDQCLGFRILMNVLHRETDFAVAEDSRYLLIENGRSLFYFFVGEVGICLGFWCWRVVEVSQLLLKIWRCVAFLGTAGASLEKCQ